MKEIFEQYGGVILTVAAILALVAVVTTLLQTGDSGVVYKALSGLINDFGNNAGIKALPNG